MEGTIFVLLLSAITFVNGQVSCPNVAPCKCYEQSSQIRCEDIRTAELNDVTLHTVFTSLTGDYDILYLHKTDLTTIKAGTFQGMTFKKIFITKNSALNDIETDAFKVSPTTTALVIRDNANLPGGNLFSIAGTKFGAGLIDVEFDMNKIAVIPPGAFLGTTAPPKFQSLERIRLDSQKTEITQIGANSFKLLPNLKQLSLDNNGIKDIALLNGAIDLTATSAKPGLTATNPGHVTIFLNKNKLKDITKEQIEVAVNADKFSVSLVLEDNDILWVKEGLFGKIIANPKSRVFLARNANISCKCNEVLTIKSSTNLKYIEGIAQPIQCVKDTNKIAIATCT